jgi:hypothetical protein
VVDFDRASAVRAWWEYVRRSSGDHIQRKSLDLPEAQAIVFGHEQINEIIYAGGASAVAVIVELLNTAQTDRNLIYVGAGPLEDLLHDHWEDTVDAIEDLARTGGPMRRALAGLDLAEGRQDRLRKWAQIDAP